MSQNTPLKLPNANIFMISPRDYRLSSRNGTVVNFKKDVPTKVPPNAYVEAIACGAWVDEDQEMPAPVEEEAKKSQPGEAEAVKLEAEAFKSALTLALTGILTKNDPEDFRADGIPKANKVIAEISPEIRRPTATEIADTFAELQEKFELAED